ncbi:MAG TPA: extracellular solute-binding protein [Candidatus Faecousia intestinavium]|nr:extracellular solute-binding protein [Candidatus Faecousia intestinavium]
MKRTLALILALAMMLGLLLSGCGGTETAETEAAVSGTTGVQDVHLKVWVPEEEQDIMQQMADSFAAAHPEYNFSIEMSIMGIDEANAQLKTDADSAADIFQMASGGVPELQKMGLLLPIGYNEAELRELYAENAITAVTAEDGLIYAVPFTPNTFFMYYNTSMFTEEDVKSLDAMLAKDLGEGVDYNVAFPVSGSWYLESFFFAAGCTLFGEDGKDPTSMDWNNEKGLAAGQYMIDLVNNPKFIDDKNGIGMSLLREGKVGAIFSGTWDASLVQEALGENYGAAKLPTANINGTDSQLRNFGDYKTYAVKSSTKYPLAAQQFAEWICNEENQLLRYEAIGVSPCITSLAESPELADDLATAALVEQSEHYYPQPNIPQINEYWTPAAAFGEGIVNKEITSENLQEQLDAFVNAVTTTLTE